MWSGRPLLVLGLVATLVVAWAGLRTADPSLRPTADEASAPPLSDDDGGSPLFSVPAVGPGDRFTRCVRLTHGGEEAGSVSLSGRVTGSLAPLVGLSVERGTGGGYGSCAGFTGSTVFSGSLAGFGQWDDERPWRAAGRERATYRFTVAAPADLPGDRRTASVDFSWEWRPGHVTPPRTRPDDPRDPATPPATPAPANPPLIAANPSGGPGPSTAPGGAGSPGARGTDRPGGRAGDPGRRSPRTPAESLPQPPRGDEPGALARLGELAEAVGRVAAEGAKRSAFPLLLLLGLGLFVLVQNRIDGRDPKLALAPVHRELDLPFGPFPPRGR